MTPKSGTSTLGGNALVSLLSGDRHRRDGA